MDELKRLADEMGRSPPLKRDMDKHGRHAPRTYQLRFGTWSQAVEAAGFSPRKKGEDYKERPDCCPLCRDEKSGLDFHHWRYGEDEIGCYLCRECHDYVHQGKAKLTNTNWLIHSVENIVERHVEQHGATDKETILQQYNMPDVGVLVEETLSAKKAWTEGKEE